LKTSQFFHYFCFCLPELKETVRMNERSWMLDPVWEKDIYSQGRHLNRWPFDCVVTFVFRHWPREKPRGSVRLLEIGCGAGNNLWFAAREGFSVTGIDGSESAIRYARQRFAEEGLSADLRVGDFTKLDFPDESFDLVLDRGALTCVGRTGRRRAVAEVRRVLMPGGKCLFNPYSDRHTSCLSGCPGPDGLTVGITAGTLTGVGAIGFVNRKEIDELFRGGWKVLSLQHLEIRQELEPGDTHAEWRVIVAKVNK
jgi:SAM-dependent methyltransferase